MKRPWISGLACLLLALPGLCRAAAAPPFCVAAVQFELEPKAKLAEGFSGKLVLRPVEREGEPIALEAKVGTPVRSALPCSTLWEVTPEFPDAWGLRVTVTAGAAGEAVTSRLALWPLGKIAGSVKLEKGEQRPKTIRMTTLAPRLSSAQSPPKGSQDCPVDANGRWTCTLPAATYDLVFAVPGFTPQYRWGYQVLPGKVGELGAVELKRGASVAGWVVVEDGAIDSASCRARLSPAIGPGNGAQLAEKIQRTTLEAPVRKDGFFQFGAVPPGTYTLEVRQKGFAPSTVTQVEVYPKSESMLREPVTLKRPFQLEVAISPPLDWLGRRWKVEVHRASPATGTFRDEVYNGSADEQGLVIVPGQAPGRFKVHVLDSRENRIFTRILNLGPAEAHQTIDLKLLTVHGTVQLGKEPLAAKLLFGGRFGSPGVALESDAEGKFHGVLPKDGWWQIDVESSSPPFQVRTKAKVEVASHERATVDIRLPATHFFGKVVMDDTGRPAPSALVSLSSSDQGEITQTADENGNFEVRGVTPGPIYAGALLSSAQGSWTSDRMVFSLNDGGDLGPVELRLRKTREVSGIVQSARGPVPGAGIRIVPFLPIVMLGDATRSDLDGSFKGQVPAMTQTAAAVVSAPGFALRAFALAVDEPPQPLQLGEEAGSLEVAFPEKPKDAEQADVSLWIFQNGLPVPTDVLYQWAAGHGREPLDSAGRSMAIPEVAPGEYRACLVSRAALVPWEASGWMAPLAKCVAGELAAGSTLRLDLAR